ncbi:hypothetical protein MCUN1_003507 [Malassezia cuniculi]|uniref:Protein GVP36 n=1 Tax=Malassezia cuniculi TaxID=948313 RepID=A0AAF0F1H9_9BASI|nr:hypothetical protein MCUN1_003507 [Malassezia cuniculi]
MEHLRNLTSSVAPLGHQISHRFGALNQQAREHFGGADDITELPEEYRQLEHRVDALKAAHAALVRTVKTYENEAYDYPHHLQDSVTHSAQTLTHTLSSWAAAATKGGVAPPAQAAAAPQGPRTLSHALSRAAAAAAIDLGASGAAVEANRGETASTNENKLGELLQQFAVVHDAVGSARLEQDAAIVHNFLVVWNAFGSQIQLALKARHAVRDARLHLDSRRQVLKSAEQSGNSARIESVRTEVEHAEDTLVSATEEAISLMKTVLENPEPIKGLAQLVNAQLEYHRKAAESLAKLQADMAGVVTSVEAEFRDSRA